MNLIRNATKSLVVLILFSVYPEASCQNIDLDDYPALKIAKETSLYKDEVDWEKIIPEYVRIAQSDQPATTKYEYLLNATGDVHGLFRDPQNFQIIAGYTGPTKETRTFSGKFFREVLNDVNARFSYMELADQVGYLRVVGIGPQFPMAEDAKLIQDGISALKEKGVNKWILDLRANGGGNMNPMLAGLSALLGEGNIGGSADPAGNPFQRFKIEKGKFYDTERLAIDIENPLSKPLDDKVAVLLSKYTVSSGEIVAVAFKGRNNTRFFGERSRGLTTVTGFDRINDKTLMLISKAYYQDRNQILYTDGVEVDVEIPFQEFVPFEEDEIILKSIVWLKQ